MDKNFKRICELNKIVRVSCMRAAVHFFFYERKETHALVTSVYVYASTAPQETPTTAAGYRPRHVNS